MQQRSMFCNSGLFGSGGQLLDQSWFVVADSQEQAGRMLGGVGDRAEGWLTKAPAHALLLHPYVVTLTLHHS